MSMDYLLNIKQNQIKMIKMRGYHIEDEAWILDEHLTGKSFFKKLIEKQGETHPSQYRTLLQSMYTHKNGKKLLVGFIGISEFSNKQISIDNINSFVECMIAENADCLIITNAILSSAANTRLGCITESKIQIFNEDELVFNLVDHIFVPKIEVLSFDEASLKMPLNKKLYKTILPSDPIYRYYNLNSGDIIKIYDDNNMLLSSNYSCRIAV